MRLSSEHITQLQDILLNQLGLELTDEQAQEAGLAIMRFVVAKAQHKQKLTKHERNVYGQ